MLSPIFESFEAHTLTILKEDSGEAWFLAKDFAAPLGVNRDSVRHQLSDLEPSDKRVISIHTSTGPKNATFISESGALQLVMQSRKPQARRLRKWVCDLAVRYAKGDLQAAGQFVTRAEFDATLTTIVQSVNTLAESMTALAQTVASLTGGSQPVRRGLRPVSEFPAWSPAEHQRMRKSSYVQASEYLTRTTGQRPQVGQAGGLAIRAGNYSKQHQIPVHRFCKGSSVLVYLHEPTLAAVNRTGWSARTATLSEAQMGLFGGTK